MKIGNLEKETRSKKVVEPMFTTDFLGAVVREGASEHTLRAREQGGWRAGHRGEAQERSRRARHRSWLRRPRVRTSLANPRLRASQTWSVDACGLHNGGTTWSRASTVEQITAGRKKLKQGSETHADNLKDLMPQRCRAGMARLSDLEVNAEELEAELVSQQDMEDRVNKLNTMISDRRENAADECDSFRARFEHHESQLKTATGDRTRIHDELRKLTDEAKNQGDGMRELEKRLEGQADERRADLKRHELATVGTIWTRHLTVTAEIEGDEEDVALTNAATESMRVTSDSCRLAATAEQRLKAHERGWVDESRLPVRA